MPSNALPPVSNNAAQRRPRDRHQVHTDGDWQRRQAVHGAEVVAGNSSREPAQVYDLFLDGQYKCSQRYSAFENLNKLVRAHAALPLPTRLAQLKARFRWFEFPPFPSKKANGLFKQILSVRRRCPVGPADAPRRSSRWRSACSCWTTTWPKVRRCSSQ